MADNLIALANTGTGTDVLATDEIAGVHYPRSKIGFGADGEYADISAANPVPVADASLATITAILEAMEDQNALTAQLIQAIKPLGIYDAAGRISVNVAAGTLAGVTTVTTVGNMALNAGLGLNQFRWQMESAYHSALNLPA